VRRCRPFIFVIPNPPRRVTDLLFDVFSSLFQACSAQRGVTILLVITGTIQADIAYS